MVYGQKGRRKSHAYYNARLFSTILHMYQEKTGRKCRLGPNTDLPLDDSQLCRAGYKQACADALRSHTSLGDIPTILSAMGAKSQEAKPVTYQYQPGYLQKCVPLFESRGLRCRVGIIRPLQPFRSTTHILCNLLVVCHLLPVIIFAMLLQLYCSQDVHIFCSSSPPPHTTHVIYRIRLHILTVLRSLVFTFASRR